MTKKASFFGVFFCCLFITSIAQQGTWVFFKDKGNTEDYYFKNPEKMLSQKSISRRFNQKIGFSYTDVPVFKDYINEMELAGYTVKYASRWMNAAYISGTYTGGFDFVNSCKPVTTKSSPAAFQGETFTKSSIQVSGYSRTTTLDYGAASNQNLMVGIDCMHDKGYTGKDVLMGIFDSGFFSADTFTAFDSVFLNNRVLNHYDFVDGQNNVFDDDSHGMSVLSTIAAFVPSSIIGTAYDASFLLARTENVNSETHAEEYSWVAAMEWADSIGVDLIHSSLSYSIFDAGEGDYTYQQMDGNSTIITIAADYAASKGIIVTNSAGNQGNSSWVYITAPADGDSVMAVGSVDGFGMVSGFSSRGPSSDQRLKPEITAQGTFTAVIGSDGFQTYSNGTSFSGPIIAGVMACLRQAHPNLSNMDLYQALYQSANQYNTPDTIYGYGIPNACKADSICAIMDSTASILQTVTQFQLAKVSPNPSTGFVNISFNNQKYQDFHLTLMDVNGNIVFEKNVGVPMYGSTSLNLSSYQKGLYFLKADTGNQVQSWKILLQ